MGSKKMFTKDGHDVKQEQRNNRKRLLAGCNLNVMVRDINKTRAIKKFNLNCCI